MAKLLIVGLLAVAAFVQIATARDLREQVNAHIRDQLTFFDKLLKDPDNAKYADNLKELIEIHERALKIDSPVEKNKIFLDTPDHFSDEFNKWINSKVNNAQLIDQIKNAIEFYKSLQSTNSEHKEEIQKTVDSLEKILQEPDFKHKEEQFEGLEKGFSEGFQKFLKEKALPDINRTLQETVEFFDKLLQDKDTKFYKEIEELKKKTEAALDNKVSIDDKSNVLKEVTLTDNSELNEFLQRKNIEFL